MHGYGICVCKPVVMCVYVCVYPLSEIESPKLARLIFNTLCETCCLWLKDFPYRRRPQPYYETSIHAIKNMRRKMEDKHIVIPDFNTLFNIQVHVEKLLVQFQICS